MLGKYAHNNDVALTYILLWFTFEKRRELPGYGWDVSWGLYGTRDQWQLTATCRIIRSRS